jgi:hypothetical protein
LVTVVSDIDLNWYILNNSGMSNSSSSYIFCMLSTKVGTATLQIIYTCAFSDVNVCKLEVQNHWIDSLNSGFSSNIGVVIYCIHLQLKM